MATSTATLRVLGVTVTRGAAISGGPCALGTAPVRIGSGPDNDLSIGDRHASRNQCNKIQIVGFSKGGGGALMAAQQLSMQGKAVGAVQPLAPYFDSWSDVNRITAPTAIHGGASDLVAPVSRHAVPMFNGLASGTKRALAIYNGLTHGEWYSGAGRERYKMKQYITAWMKVYLDANTGYQTYLNGDGHQASWFRIYNYAP